VLRTLHVHVESFAQSFSFLNEFFHTWRCLNFEMKVKTANF
jgi:hypothetical protein